MAIIGRDLLRYILTWRLMGTIFCGRMGSLVTLLDTGGIQEGTQDWPRRQITCVSEFSQVVDT